MLSQFHFCPYPRIPPVLGADSQRSPCVSKSLFNPFSPLALPSRRSRWRSSSLLSLRSAPSTATGSFHCCDSDAQSGARTSRFELPSINRRIFSAAPRRVLEILNSRSLPLVWWSSSPNLLAAGRATEKEMLADSGERVAAKRRCFGDERLESGSGYLEIDGGEVRRSGGCCGSLS